MIPLTAMTILTRDLINISNRSHKSTQRFYFFAHLSIRWPSKSPGDNDRAQGIHFVAKGHDESRNAVGVNLQSSHQFARSIFLKSAEQIKVRSPKICTQCKLFYYSRYGYKYGCKPRGVDISGMNFLNQCIRWNSVNSMTSMKIGNGERDIRKLPQILKK